jgi:hypothetical protein
MLQTVHSIIHDQPAGQPLPAKEVGRRVVLPSSFIGSKRHYNQLYQDAMAVTRKHGKPDLFVTFTCNPKWPEIVNAAKEQGTEGVNRFDLISRVFRLKLDAMPDDIIKNGVLGKVAAHVHVIEFQVSFRGSILGIAFQLLLLLMPMP